MKKALTSIFVLVFSLFLICTGLAQTRNYRAGVLTVERWIETLRGAPVLNSGYYRQTYSGTVADAFELNYTGSGNLLMDLQADGAPVFTLEKDGDLDVIGHVAIGNDASINSNYALYVQEDVTRTSGLFEAGFFSTQPLPTGDTSAFYIGSLGEVWIDTISQNFSGNVVGDYGYVRSNCTGNFTGYVAGGKFRTSHNGTTGTMSTAEGVIATVTNDNAGTITDAYGIEATVFNNSSGQIDNAFGLWSKITAASTGTIDNGYGIYVATPVTTGTLTANYGIYLEDQTGGGTNYSIYSAGGDSYHAGGIDFAESIDWSGGNVIYVPLSGDIQTYVNAAVDGDTLVLAAGNYIVTSTITIAKQLNIRGQGNAGFATIPVTPNHGTLISSTTAAVTALQIDHDNVRIADMSINLSGAGSKAINTGMDLTGLVFTNIDVIIDCSGIAQGFTIYSSNVVLRGLTFYVTSSDSNAYGVWFWNDGSTTQNSVCDSFYVTGTVVGAGAGYAYAFACANLNDDNTITLNLHDSVCKTLTGTSLDVAVGSYSVGTNNAIVNAYLCTFDGADFDAYVSGTNELNLGGSVLENNTIFGTPTYRAAMVSGIVQSPQVNGGILANEDVAIQGTTHGTRTTSYVVLQPTGGNVGIRTTTPDTLVELSEDAADTVLTVSTYHDTEGTTPTLTMRKADNTEASPQPIDAGAILGTINFDGYDDDSFDNGARIYAKADANWGTSERGTELYLSTRDGAGALTDQFKVTANGNLRGATSKWYTAQHFEVLNLSPGGSGPVQVLPSADTLGGYNLDGDTEYLYFTTHIHSDWDGASDILVEIIFECDVDNTGGNVGDDAEFDLLCYYKGDGETSNKTQSPTTTVTVDQSPRYKRFAGTFVIDYDIGGGNDVDVGDVITHRINFDQTNSDIADVVLVHITLQYQTAKVNEEI